MPKIPRPKDVIDSNVFAHWCEQMTEHLNGFETELVQKVALEQQAGVKTLRVHQTVVDVVSNPGTASDYGYHEMIDRQEAAAYQWFALLSEPDIRALCAEKHYYVHNGERIPVRLQPSQAYLKRESRLAEVFGTSSPSFFKQLFLPLLTFPFLPYSRKMLVLTDERGIPLGDDSPLPRQLYRDKFEWGGSSVMLASQLLENRVPVWNIRSDIMYVAPQVEKEADGLWSWYIQERSFNENATYIIHKAIKRGVKEPVHIADADGQRVRSKFDFDDIDFSEIGTPAPEPPDQIFTYPITGRQQIDKTQQFWYRAFLQAFQLTPSDITALLSMIPETQGRLEYRGVEVAPCTPEFFDELLSEYRPCVNYLWYLNKEDYTRKSAPSNLSVVTIRLAWKPDPTQQDAFLKHDLVNYFASLCSLYLPMGFVCRGELVS